MPFTPQHDFGEYNAAVAKQLRLQSKLTAEESFQRCADYFNTLVQARRQLSAGWKEAQSKRKREKIRLHAKLAKIYIALDES